MSVVKKLAFEISCPCCDRRLIVSPRLSELGSSRAGCSACQASFFIGDAVLAELLLLRDQIATAPSFLSLEN